MTRAEIETRLDLLAGRTPGARKRYVSTRRRR